MGKTRFGGTTQQVVMGLVAALMFIMAVEASQLGFGGGFGFFGWDGEGNLGWHSATFTESDGMVRVRVNQGGCKLKLEQHGEVAFSDDERDFAAFGPGASFELLVKGCGDKLEVTATGGAAAGAPTVKAKLGGNDVPWDERARGHFHDALQLVFATGYDASGRVDRLFQRGGAAAVLAAAEKIGSDGAQRTYLEMLLGKDALSAEDAAKTWRLAGSSLGSDYELAQLVVDASARYFAEPPVRTAVAGALRSIGSDYELRRALETLLQQGAAADPQSADELLGIAADKITSDYEQAEFLGDFAERLPAGAPLPAKLDQALSSISSDYELRRTLTTYGERPGLRRADLDRLLEVAAAEISSDYELAELLISVARSQKGAEPWPPGLEKAIGSISSDHEELRARQAFE